MQRTDLEITASVVLPIGVQCVFGHESNRPSRHAAKKGPPVLSTSTTTNRTYAKSSRLHAEACEVLAGGVNSNFRLGGQPVPLVFERAAGARLYDVDGNAYLD
jgi:4-aminobutyrate aminotransferase-like enzyme